MRHTKRPSRIIFGPSRAGARVSNAGPYVAYLNLFFELRNSREPSKILTRTRTLVFGGRSRRVIMKTRNTVALSMIAAGLGATALAFASGSVLAQSLEKKGTTPYVTHFIFRPLMSIDIPGLGTATNLEAVGTTQNMKGEKMLDKMSAHCAALNVASGDKKYIDGACVLTDNDGDKIFSTFDTRDVDKSQPEMSCGTHIITGGTGKYKGITGKEPFACISMPALAGPGGYTAMDIPHNTSWEIK
jgi:hypothetical protein